MASLRKKANCSNWFGCFTTVDGRRVQRSTGTPVRSKALDIALEYERAYRGRKTARQVQKVMSDLYRSTAGAEAPKSTVKDFLDRWLEQCKLQVEPSTYAFYRLKVGQFVEFLGDRKTADLNEIEKRHIIAFRDDRLSQVSTRHNKGNAMTKPVTPVELAMIAAALLPDGTWANESHLREAVRQARHLLTIAGEEPKASKPEMWLSSSHAAREIGYVSRNWRSQLRIFCVKNWDGIKHALPQMTTRNFSSGAAFFDDYDKRQWDPRIVDTLANLHKTVLSASHRRPKKCRGRSVASAAAN